MSYSQINQNTIGELGELSVINKFVEFELTRPLYSLQGFEKIPGFRSSAEYEHFFKKIQEI